MKQISLGRWKEIVKAIEKIVSPVQPCTEKGTLELATSAKNHTFHYQTGLKVH